MIKINILKKMKKSIVTIPVLSAMMIGLLSSATAARADSISIVLAAPYQSALSGDTVSFFATVTDTDGAGSAPLYLNGYSQTLDSPLTLDGTGFWSSFAGPLTPGESIYGELFSVLVPAGTPTGPYKGVFVIQGGSDGAAQVNLDSAIFNIENTSQSVLTPEPSTWLLLATGLVGLAVLSRHRAKNGWARQSICPTAQ